MAFAAIRDNMKSNKHSVSLLPRISAVLGVLLTYVGVAGAAVVDVGNPFTPAGSDFQIFATQGIDNSNPLGQSGFSPQVNQNFEYQGSTGVAYDQGGGKLKDFGIGLYSDTSHQTESTGLLIRYNASVNAASVTITVEDFDIKNDKSQFFQSGKVAPGILLLGSNNTVIASADPAVIFADMTLKTPTSDDVWNVNLGQVLDTLHLPDTSVAGFLLYADQNNGEKANSDPYLLVSVGNGVPAVPEPSNYLAGAVAILIGGAFQFRQLRLKWRQGRS